mgnify:CR=1 FL=1
MNKIRKFFAGVGSLIRWPFLINTVLEANLRWKSKFEKNYPGYRFRQIPFSGLMKGPLSLNEISLEEGSGLITDLAMIKLLSSRFPGGKYLEIGTFRGESVIQTHGTMKKSYTLNLPLEDLKKMGMSEEYTRQIGSISRGKEGIIHLEGDSKSFDFEGLGENFDLIFIDGDHHFDMVENDTRKTWPVLNKKTGIMVWHDVRFHSGELRFEVLSGIFSGLPAEAHKNLYFITNTLSLVYWPADPLASETFLHWKSDNCRYRIVINPA